MYDVVPGALQRLREADIVSMAGLMVASLGQEYYRRGSVHATKRQGAQLSGIVEIAHTTLNQAASTTNDTIQTQRATISSPGAYVTEVELRDRISCAVTCSCRQPEVQPGVVCPHAAALLYAWLAHPANFEVISPPIANEAPLSTEQEIVEPLVEDEDDVLETKKAQIIAQPAQIRATHVPSPPSNTVEILAQSGLSELRAIARTYDISTNGLNRQELAQHIVSMLQQPETIRSVVTSLEKQQRQLLAALTLAGGSMSDEDLRGLLERFSLGKPAQLLDMLHMLQGKALIIRATFNSSLQRRNAIGLSSSALEVCWYVPAEVRSALHVTMPITPFSFENDGDQGAASYKVEHKEAYSLLTDLLLVARALNGKWLEYDGKNSEGESNRMGGNIRSLNPLPVEGSIPIPLPEDMPSKGLLQYLKDIVPRPLPFLRFAIRILRLADILYFEHESPEFSKAIKMAGNDITQDEDKPSERFDESGSNTFLQEKRKSNNGTSILHVLPNAARLLLGLNKAEVAHELFVHWLNRASYDELFDLQDEGLRLRCRANTLLQPALRSDELRLENMDARQTLVSLLAQTPQEQWINFSSFARFVSRLNPHFLQKRQDQFSSPHWWIEQEDGRVLHPTRLSDWMLAEGRYLAQLLQGPLYWWGICDVALSPDNRLLAFRLMPLANALLNGTSQEDQLIQPEIEASMPVSDVEIKDSYELTVPCTFTHWPFIELIERFAEMKGAQGSRLCYQLTPESLGEAFARGETPSVLLELLHSMAKYQHLVAPDGPLASLLVQLERRIASYGRVRFYTDVSLLEAADQQVVRELSATTSYQEQIVRSINPTLFILKKNTLEELHDELNRRGQVPFVHDAGTMPLAVARTEAQHESK
ncbi:MAG TPA: helicase-associated domain-containing protein [Ktedonobacteraceae bacterium]|nr:helicase-associated domain-containing protein [Ktedonobacteraceae bacterium]